MMPLSSSDRPEPVIDAAKIAAAVSGAVLAIGALLVLVGWATADEVKSWAVVAGGIVTAVGTLVAVVMPVITAYGARAQVTPLAAPLGVDGVPLVTTAQPPAAARREPVEITDALRELDEQDRQGLATVPVRVAWRPPTPAAVAAEPTPIAAEAEAATTGRIPAVTG